MKKLLLLVIIGMCVFGGIITHGNDVYQGIFSGIGILACVLIVTYFLMDENDSIV
jgi:hypothetical protein